MFYVHTSHTKQQSWLIPFWPLLEKTEAKLLEPYALTVPDEHNIKSLLLASFAMASAASLPSQLPLELVPFFVAIDLASPLNIDDRCPISFSISSPKMARYYFSCFFSLYDCVLHHTEPEMSKKRTITLQSQG